MSLIPISLDLKRVHEAKGQIAFSTERTRRESTLQAADEAWSML